MSRSVAQAAYDQLHAEGWIEGRTGSGTYVADVVPLQPAVLRTPARPPEPAATAPHAAARHPVFSPYRRSWLAASVA